MLTPRSNLDDLIARLSAVPSAVQTSTSAALAAYVRARSSGVAKAAAIKAYMERTRPTPLSSVGRGRGPAAGREGGGRSGRPQRGSSPHLLLRGEKDTVAALVKAAAIKAALNALGRSS